MSELQAGMLALVIGGEEIDNIGKTVCVIHSVKENDLLPCGNYSMTTGWVCDGEDLKTNLYDEGVVVETTVDSWGLFDSAHLLPIPPLSDPLDQKQQQELHA